MMSLESVSASGQKQNRSNDSLDEADNIAKSIVHARARTDKRHSADALDSKGINARDSPGSEAESSGLQLGDFDFRANP